MRAVIKLSLLVVLFGLPARAAILPFHFSNLTNYPGATMTVKLTPTNPPNNGPIFWNGRTILLDPKTYTTDTNGDLTVSNVAPYRIIVEAAGPYKVTPFQITVPDTNGVVDVGGISSVGTNLTGSASSAYSIAAADLRFVARTNGTATGLSSTNTVLPGSVTIPSTGVSNYVLTATNATGAAAWQPAASGGITLAAGTLTTTTTNGSVVTVNAASQTNGFGNVVTASSNQFVASNNGNGTNATFYGAAAFNGAATFNSIITMNTAVYVPGIAYPGAHFAVIGAQPAGALGNDLDAGLTTDNLTEGSLNLFYTAARSAVSLRNLNGAGTNTTFWGALTSTNASGSTTVLTNGSVVVSNANSGVITVSNNVVTYGTNATASQAKIQFSTNGVDLYNNGNLAFSVSNGIAHVYGPNGTGPLGLATKVYQNTLSTNATGLVSTDLSILGTGSGTLTIPANSVQVGTKFILQIGGTVTNGSGSSRSFTFTTRLNATSVGSTSGTLGTSPNTAPLNILNNGVFFQVESTGASGSVRVGGSFDLAGIAGLVQQETLTTIDWTIAQTINLSWQCANATPSLRIDAAIVHREDPF